MIEADHGLQGGFDPEEGDEHEAMKVIDDGESGHPICPQEVDDRHIVACHENEHPHLSQQAREPDGEDTKKSLEAPCKCRLPQGAFFFHKMGQEDQDADCSPCDRGDGSTRHPKSPDENRQVVHADVDQRHDDQ